MAQLFIMAFRDLGRNRRRAFFSALAIAVSLALLMLVSSFMEGEIASSIETTIRLQSGHLQIRAQSYDEGKTSLKWDDLVESPNAIVAQIAALEPVKIATPRLFASGFISDSEEATGVRIIGMDPLSEANDPYRDGLINGEYLTPDDREGILIGQPLAENLGVSSGEKVNLSVNTSNGDVVDQLFTIRGVYSTHTNGFDSVTVFMPLAKAQAISQTEDHASTIFVLLKETEQTDAVAAALQTSNYQILTWKDMNELILQTEEMAGGYIGILYMIVLAISATVIINTLIMAVFERTREIGILSAIGMKGWRISSMFMAESTLLAIGGVILGLFLGFLVVVYFSRQGFYIGNMGMTGFLISDTIYPRLTMQDTVNLTVATFIAALLSGLYPAVLASRMEPVQALRAEK